MKKPSASIQAVPVMVSHDISWALGALYGLCTMEFGIWPTGVLVGLGTIVTRVWVERPAIKAHAIRVKAATLREAADEIRDQYTCNPAETPRQTDPECVAFDDAIRFLRVTADEIVGGR